MSKKIPISRNLSDPKSRAWWAAIDEIANRPSRLDLEPRPFPKPEASPNRAKPSTSGPSRSKK